MDQGPPGPAGAPGSNGSGITFDNFSDIDGETFQPSDSGQPVTILGYYEPGDGGYSYGYLSDTPAPVGIFLTVTDRVVTMTARDHGLKSGDFINVTGAGTRNVTVQPVQVVDEDTFRYVANAADIGNTAVTATITPVSAGIYRQVRPTTNGGSVIFRATSRGVITAWWFGARASGDTADATINTTGINRASDAAWGEQCEWWVPRGQDKYWIDSTLHMREGTVLRLHGYIKAYPDPSVTPFMSVDGHPVGNAFCPLFIAKNEHRPGSVDVAGNFTTYGTNFTILGDNLGVIDGSAMEMAPIFALPDAVSPLVPGAYTYYKLGQPSAAFGVSVNGIEHLLISDLTVKDASTFGIGLLFCRHTRIVNPYVDTGNGNQIVDGIPLYNNGKNQDGIHHGDCWDYEVLGGHVESSDDELPCTAIYATNKNGRMIGVECIHKMTGNPVSEGGAGDFVCLGYGARISGAGGACRDSVVENVVFDTCIFEGGYGAAVIRGNPVVRTATTITRSGTTATFNSVNHGFHVGDTIEVTNATAIEYNGSHVIHSVATNSFTYTITGTPGTSVGGTAAGIGYPMRNILFTNCTIKDKILPGITNPANELQTFLARQVFNIAGVDGFKMVNCKFDNINREIYISRFAGEPETKNVSIFNNELSNFGIIEDIIRTASSVTHGTGPTAAIATFNTTGAFNYVAGEVIVVSGANLSAYNGQFTILAVGANSFTYTMGSDPGANPTGTIKVRSLKGITSWAIHAVSIEGPIEGLKIKGNKIKNTWNGGINAAGNISVPSAIIDRSLFKSVDIDGNELENINQYVNTYNLTSGGSGAILGAVGLNWSVSNNRVTNCFGAGIYLFGRVANAVIGGNKLTNLGRPTYAVATSLTRVSGGGIFLTATAHGFVVGETVIISGAEQPQYNGRVLIVAAGTLSFSFVMSSTAEPTATTLTEIRATSTTVGTMTDAYGIALIGTSGGPGNQNLSMYDNDVFGCDANAFLMESVDSFDCVRDRAVAAGRNGAASPIFHTYWRTVSYVSTATGVTHSGVTATFTTGNAHRFVTGQKVTITGADQAPYNGFFVITVVTDFIFTYTMLSDPGANATGTVLGTGAVYDFRNVRGMFRHCRAATFTAAQNAFSAQIAGTMLQLPGVIAGTPVVFDNCDFSGPTTAPYSITPGSADVYSVPLPLGTVRKGSVIGGLYNVAANTRSVLNGILTSSGTTATFDAGGPHGLTAGQVVSISGATPGGYNISTTINATPTANTFTYTLAGALTSPATGNIIAILGGAVASSLDFDIPIPISNLGNKYRITGIELRNADTDMSPQILVAEIRTAPNGGGDPIVSTVTVATMTGGAGVRELVIEPQTLTAGAGTQIRTGTELYLRVATPQAGAFDVVVTGELIE